MKSPIEIIRDLQSRKVVAIHIVQVTEDDIAQIQRAAYAEGYSEGHRDGGLDVEPQITSGGTGEAAP